MLKLYSIQEKLQTNQSLEESCVIDDVFVKIYIENVQLPVVYTFSNASDITKTEDVNNLDYSPWGFDFVRKRGLNVISFSSFNSESWYRSREFHLWIERVLSKISSYFPYRFAYGSSMGGFGASVFADILGVEKLLLINPLSSLNKNVVPFESRFKHGSSLDWSGQYNDGSINNATGYVVFDPLFDLDSKHAKRYANLEN